MHFASQFGQDRWILAFHEYKKNGFFVEAGACDGIELSNTLVLERSFGWNGICCEPSKHYQEMLKVNRNCSIDFGCLHSDTGEIVSFCTANEPTWGTMKVHANSEPEREQNRLSSDIYDVTTISLNDLLEKHNAPNKIDYISLDTEGSELDIISAFDFEKYDVSAWTIEHNSKYRADGEEYLNKIVEIMKSNGYVHERHHTDARFWR